MKKWDFVTNILKEEKKGLTIKPVKFNPINIRRTYGISLKFQEGNNIRETQIHYKMDAIHLYANDDDTHILELCKQQIYINEKSPDSIMEELADKCGKVLYPLHIKVDANGQLLGITNQPMIKQRWELAKKQLAKEFTGKEVQLLLKNMTEVVNDLKKMTVAILEHDWFFSLFFAPVFSIRKDIEIGMPLIPYSIPVKFKMNTIVEEHPHKIGEHIITLKGNCSDPRSERDILKGNLIPFEKQVEKQKGTVNLKYHIYKNSSFLNIITGDITLNFSSGKSKKVTVECYNLKGEPQPKTLTEKEALKDMEDQKELETLQKKKKKRYLLF